MRGITHEEFDILEDAELPTPSAEELEIWEYDYFAPPDVVIVDRLKARGLVVELPDEFLHLTRLGRIALSLYRGMPWARMP